MLAITVSSESVVLQEEIMTYIPVVLLLRYHRDGKFGRALFEDGGQTPSGLLVLSQRYLILLHLLGPRCNAHSGLHISTESNGVYEYTHNLPTEVEIPRNVSSKFFQGRYKQARSRGVVRVWFIHHCSPRADCACII